MLNFHEKQKFTVIQSAMKLSYREFVLHQRRLNFCCIFRIRVLSRCRVRAQWIDTKGAHFELHHRLVVDEGLSL